MSSVLDISNTEKKETYVLKKKEHKMESFNDKHTSVITITDTIKFPLRKFIKLIENKEVEDIENIEKKSIVLDADIFTEIVLSSKKNIEPPETIIQKVQTQELFFAGLFFGASLMIMMISKDSFFLQYKISLIMLFLIAGIICLILSTNDKQPNPKKFHIKNFLKHI
jgi:hypothetical protein